MSYDEKTAGRVRALLSRRPDVVEKKMFGGLCFMVHGSMCCGLTTTALMVRVGRDQFEDALAQPHARPLAKWIQRGVDFVSRAPARKSAARCRRKPATR